MKFLAIDTSAKKLAIAVQGANGASAYEIDCAMQHSVRLMGEIDSALKKAALSLKDCNFFACVVGPGSFTGIRIGISTVKGLAFALEKPVLAITSFEAIAYAEEEENKIALVDAGHGHVYAEGFGAAHLPRGYYPHEEVLACAEQSNAILLASEEVAGIKVKCVRVAEGLLRAVRAKKGDTMSASELAAMYLRKSSAEEGR